MQDMTVDELILFIDGTPNRKKGKKKKKKEENSDTEAEIEAFRLKL